VIHLLQVLCGPERHAICGMLYDDKALSATEAREGIELLVEEQCAMGFMKRRCEICDASVIQFLYEDGISKEQDWDKARAQVARSEAEQMLTRQAVMAARMAEKN
jgi:hypothetical protein